MRKKNGSIVTFLPILLALIFGGGGVGAKAAAVAPSANEADRAPGAKEADHAAGTTDAGAEMKRIYLAGGCFWGVEKYLSRIPGILFTEVGYANGRTRSPSYEDVCYQDSGHAETVLVEYDPHKLELSFLLELFYQAIDPTSLNRQGFDVGAQYRSGIYYTDEADRAVIEGSITQLGARLPAPVVIEIKPLENYYAAEEYHQKYLDKNPAGYCHISSAMMNKAANAVCDRK